MVAVRAADIGIDRGEFRVVPKLAQGVFHRERRLDVGQAPGNFFRQMQVFGVVHAQMGLGRAALASKMRDLEFDGMVPDIGNDMLSLGPEPRLSGDAPERLDAEDVEAEPVGDDVRAKKGVGAFA